MKEKNCDFVRCAHTFTSGMCLNYTYGSQTKNDGNQLFQSDGTFGEMVGAEIWWSDGSKSTR